MWSWVYDDNKFVFLDFLHIKEKKTPMFFSPLLFWNFLLFLVKLLTDILDSKFEKLSLSPKAK